MLRLIRIVVIALAALLTYSVVNEVWRATTFDSEFTGMVQRTSAGDPSLAEGVAQLAAAKGIALVDDSFSMRSVGDRTEVMVRQRIPLGLGGLSYTWERSVSAFTEGAAPFGAPLSGAQAPSTPAPGPGMLNMPSRVSKSLQDAQGR